MEMDSVQLTQNGDYIEDISVEQLIVYNVFGDPEVFPRVGDQYQVEIPPLNTESEYLLYTKNPFVVEFASHVPFDFLMGLPIPVMRIKKDVEYKKHKGQEFLADLKDEDSKFKVDPLDVAWENGVGSGDLINLASKHKMKLKVHQNYSGEGHCLVPGSSFGSWSDIELASFLLGLYIFGKNLVQVKRFIDNKSMGDILSFYYGNFYRSVEYRRWSDGRKMRSRRCVYGQRIFTGLRQQELLSRLFVRVSEECQSTLLEVSKTFGEGKMLLEEYVFALKAIVGMNNLVEAVGICKGKQSLTSISVEPLKSNHVIPMRPEVPIGKACSYLTPGEIVRFLTGDFRLSKARSSDLFWEAVWPRLLARGWHSEQPRDKVYAAGSKHSLVFLLPGVKKFSRRRLVKGDHYFDSVSDVLSKVASDPGLLKLDTESDEGNGNKAENGWTVETKLEHENLSDRQRHCYLQPRTPNHSTELVNFTIVDTSLADAKTSKVRELRTLPVANGKISKARELRTLPVEVSKKTTSRSYSEEIGEDNSEVSSEDLDSVRFLSFDQENNNDSNSKKTASSIGMFSDVNDHEIGSWVKNSKDLHNFCDEKKPRNSLKCRQKLKVGNLNYLAPVTKRRRRLSSCTRTELSHGLLSFSASLSFEQEKHSCCSETADSSDNNLYGMGLYQKRVSVSSTSSSKDTPIENREAIFCDNNFAKVDPCEKSQPQALIDLNLLQVSPEFETVEASTATQPSENGTQFADQANGNFRRQGTRNRPPTARALEALANGFLTTKRKWRNKEASLRENSTPRPSRQHGRSGMAVTESFGTDTVASQMGVVGNGACNDNCNMFSKFQFLSEGNAELKFQDPKLVSSWEALT